MSSELEALEAKLQESGLVPDGAGEEQPEVAADDDVPAEAQPDEAEAKDELEAALGRMPLNKFLDLAGVSMEEFYRDVFVERNGAEVSVSQAWDDYQQLSESIDTLSRERDDLKQRLDQSATHVPQSFSPEAERFKATADVYRQALAQTDWSQMDPTAALAQKFEFKEAIDLCERQAREAEEKYQGDVRSKLMEARAEADRQTRTRIKTWADENIMRRDKQRIKDALAPYGIRANEVDMINDPRTWQAFLDLAELRGKVAAVTKGAEKVRKVPKTLGAGARAPTDRKMSVRDVKHRLNQAKTPQERTAAMLEVDLGPLS